MPLELAVLAWFAVAAGIVAGAFLVARAAVQLAAIAYGVMERRLDRAAATRQSLAVGTGLLAALAVTALIAALAILTALEGLPLPLEAP